MRYFKKEGLKNPIRFQSKLVNFEPISDNTGVIQLDDTQDAPLVAELDRLADARKMGVIRISAEVRESLIQKKSFSKPRPAPAGFNNEVRSFNRESVLPKSLKPKSEGSSNGAAPAANRPSGVIRVPTAEERAIAARLIAPSPELIRLQKETGAPVPTPIPIPVKLNPENAPRAKAKRAKRSEVMAAGQPEATV